MRNKLWFIHEMEYYRAGEKYELNQPVSIWVNLNKKKTLSSEKQAANWYVQYDTINEAKA